MPITPKFSLRQDDEYLYVDVVVPYVKVTSMEFAVVDGTQFSFYCKPYLLKLNLPGPVIDEDERAEALYDPDREHGLLVVKLVKANRGEVFPNLDLISVLLQPKASFPVASLAAAAAGRALIEEIPGDDDDSATDVASTSDGAPFRLYLLYFVDFLSKSCVMFGFCSLPCFLGTSHFPHRLPIVDTKRSCRSPD